MTIYQWLCLVGFPAIFSSIIGYFIGKAKKQRKEAKALGHGVQALLRAQMISDYNKYMEKGYAPIFAKQNFENLWTQYEALGENGVMSGLHNDFMHLPNGIDLKSEEKE